MPRIGMCGTFDVENMMMCFFAYCRTRAHGSSRVRKPPAIFVFRKSASPVALQSHFACRTAKNRSLSRRDDYRRRSSDPVR